MVTERTARSYLRRSIALAERLEVNASPQVARKKVTIVGFGFLIRNRRLAQAVLRLGKRHAYEGRMLLRSMIEILINYVWIRLRTPEWRANRFLKFQPLERFMIHKDLYALNPSNHYASFKKFKSERAKVGYLFRNRRKKRLLWDKTWASTTSLESRVREVLKSESGRSEGFLYVLYRWSSSAVHGGPLSLTEVLEARGELRAKLQPEIDPKAQIVSAFLTLMTTIRILAKDIGVLNDLEPELSKLEGAEARVGD